MIRSLAVMLCVAVPAHADGAQNFVTANLVSTLHHEFGHALIGPTVASVSGQEERAADMLSVVLLDELRELNNSITLSQPPALAYISYGAENAFYDSEAKTISICTEYVAFLERQAVANNL